MPSVSVIIPTHNRPALLERAIRSVLGQTWRDLEVIVVDDGLKERADRVIASFQDERLVYIAHDRERGGGAARNTGIKQARGEFIAFLDDDDEWLPEKLAVQLEAFAHTGGAGFCFTSVIMAYDDHEEISRIPNGEADYFEFALSSFKSFLTVTLMVQKQVLFELKTFFDESFPTHQETDLVLRMAKKYKGVGVNKPLVRVNMSRSYEHIGSSWERRVKGREMILEKHAVEFQKHPQILARHYFWLAVMYRDAGKRAEARRYFKKAWRTHFLLNYFVHYLISYVRR